MLLLDLAFELLLIKLGYHFFTPTRYTLR